ncbi:tetratricopeptide repeat protein [Rhodanobacter ginsengisoli]|uniref:Tetratricopeptide repeat protein n=1 Tax=Rhodanobacter ginsengisoli TaxID=418646 RepID=A0ABW0QTI4_9GAMM
MAYTNSTDWQTPASVSASDDEQCELVLRGDTLARAGQLDAAEAILRQALMRKPHDATATAHLARILLGLGRTDDASRLVDDFLCSTVLSAPPELLLLRAQILLALRAWSEAIVAFRYAIDAAPDNGIAELGLAVALGESGQIETTATAARRAIAKGADSPGARYVLGRALLAANRPDEAEAQLRQVLTLQPDHVAAHCSLTELIWMRSGNVDAAMERLDDALRDEPNLFELRIMKARLLESSGDRLGALAALEAGLTHPAGSLALRLAATKTAVHIDPARAMLHARHALQLGPGNAAAVGAYADTLLAMGRARELATVAARLHEFNPDDSHAIALLLCAWRMLDDPRHRELGDYSRVVRTSLIDTPVGWSDLASYLGDLARSLHQLHSMREHPIDQTLRFGTQVELHPEQSGDRAIQAFPEAIAGPIRRYLEALGGGTDLLRRRHTGACRLNGIWSVRLRPNGHHLNHFHGKGWISSACYIELPETMGEQAGQGWLKFGEPAMPTTPALPAEYFIRPEPGLLALFPSWMWHGTVPFYGSPLDRRLTMAFDLLPA